jgi:hypothetical protein
MTQGGSVQVDELCGFVDDLARAASEAGYSHGGHAYRMAREREGCELIRTRRYCTW